MNILVLGAGSIGKRHIKNLVSLKKEEDSISVVEPNQERQKEVEALGIEPKNIFSSRSEALAFQKYTGGIVATPTSLHYEDAVDLVQNNISVMVEKPLGVDAKRADELEKLAKKHDVFAFTAYCFRFDPVANKFAELLKEGIVGKPLYARAEMSTYLPEWHPHEDYRDFYMSKKNLGGGTLLDQSHLYDMTQWFFGDFKETYGITKKHSHLEIQTDDFGEFIFEMTSGIIVSVHIDLFTRPWREFYTVTGEKGTVTWNIHTREIILELENSASSVLMKGTDYNQMYINEIQYFLDQLSSNGALEGPTYNDGKRVVEIIDAIRESHDTKKVVNC